VRSNNFVGSESGQIQSVKLLQNILIHIGNRARGRVEPERRGERQQEKVHITKLG